MFIIEHSECLGSSLDLLLQWRSGEPILLSNGSVSSVTKPKSKSKNEAGIVCHRFVRWGCFGLQGTVSPTKWFKPYEPLLFTWEIQGWFLCFNNKINQGPRPLHSSTQSSFARGPYTYQLKFAGWLPLLQRSYLHVTASPSRRTEEGSTGTKSPFVHVTLIREENLSRSAW